MDYLEQLPHTIYREKIEAVRKKRQRWVSQQKKGFLRYRLPCEQLGKFTAETIDCTGRVVTIGHINERTTGERELVREQLRAFMPWRKGPFSIFGVDIDAEWQSDRKWQRLENYLPDMAGAVVADIGCSNGYYMFRMTPMKPRFVIGFEPSVQHYYCFKALNSMAGFDNLDIDLLGVEHISLFPESFDVVFLMGVIYHRSSPVDVLRDIFSALKPGGMLILESQAIPGDDPVALFPQKTYAKVPGTYFVPTGVCLRHWLERTGYQQVELFCTHPMNSEEQRRTEWMVFESYNDFLDPDNPALTCEGYPAPWRVFIKAHKPL